jgi:predicted GTPase
MPDAEKSRACFAIVNMLLQERPLIVAINKIDSSPTTEPTATSRAM